MRIKGLFWIFTILILSLLSVLSYHVFYGSSFKLFLIVEGIILLVVIYLIFFYQRLIKPMQLIGDGMDLLKGQDFSSRLREVGEPEADRIVAVFNRMITELKNERLHLREQNQLLDLLVNASPLGVLILDRDYHVILANPAICKILGINDPKSIFKKKLGDIDSPFISELLKIEPYKSRTLSLGNAHIYKATHSSIVDKGFHQSFYLIEPLTEEVYRAEKKAYEKVIRMIAHEVNNTTAGITSSLDSLGNALKEVLPTDEERDLLQTIIERSYKMNRFISNFADVIRIPEPDLREQDLNTLVLSSKRFMEAICRDRNIRLITDLDEVPTEVLIDTVLFEQVLINIIKNAAESIGADGEIYIKTSHDPVVLEIGDTGKGISEKVAGKLFSPFFSTKPYGQGLGLIFVREVLHKHGFSFSLLTYPDGITRFKIVCFRNDLS